MFSLHITDKIYRFKCSHCRLVNTKTLHESVACQRITRFSYDSFIFFFHFYREANNEHKFSEDLIRHFQQKLMDAQSVCEKQERENEYHSMRFVASNL